MTQDSNTKSANKHGGGRRRTGSLEWRGGTWCARVTVSIDGVAMRQWVRLETDSKAVARRKMARVVAQQNAPSAEQVAELAARAETYAELSKRIAEQRRAEGLAGCRSEESTESVWVIPEVGHLAIGSIRPEHIAGIYENARKSGKSLSLIRNLRTVMQSRFNSAVEDEIIASSPVDRVRIPKAKIDWRERAVLTDTELAIYLAWIHPLKHHQLAVLERQTMSALARMFGGLRTGDIHALNWGHFDITIDDAGEPLGSFTWGMALRRKTARPQRIAVPESLRPILRDWWTRAGRPSAGLVFPALRGSRAGVGVKKGVSHAEAMRRDLQAAFIAHREANPKAPAAVLDASCPAKDSERWKELFEETEFTRPVNFHSWRRKFVQALADMGMNAQQAQKLAGHSDLAAHERYLRTSSRTLEIPVAALPDLTTRVLPQSWAKLEAPDSQPSLFLCTPGRIRTCDQWVRNPLLYPTELRAH